MANRETLEQAGMTYVRAGSHGTHILKSKEGGNPEEWFHNPGHASYGITHTLPNGKKLDLEFARSLKESDDGSFNPKIHGQYKAAPSHEVMTPGEVQKRAESYINQYGKHGYKIENVSKNADGSFSFTTTKAGKVVHHTFHKTGGRSQSVGGEVSNKDELANDTPVAQEPRGKPADFSALYKAMGMNMTPPKVAPIPTSQKEKAEKEAKRTGKPVKVGNVSIRRMSDVDESIDLNEAIHRVGVTVSDPNATAITKRKEKIFKTVRISGDSKEDAMNRAKQHFKRNGYKVHDTNYIEEGVWEVHKQTDGKGAFKPTGVKETNLPFAKKYYDERSIKTGHNYKLIPESVSEESLDEMAVGIDKTPDGKKIEWNQIGTKHMVTLDGEPAHHGLVDRALASSIYQKLRTGKQDKLQRESTDEITEGLVRKVVDKLDIASPGSPYSKIAKDIVKDTVTEPKKTAKEAWGLVKKAAGAIRSPLKTANAKYESVE